MPVIPELERSEIRHGGRFAKDRERMLARGANVVVHAGGVGVGLSRPPPPRVIAAVSPGVE